MYFHFKSSTLFNLFLICFTVKKFSYAYTQEFPYRANHILECEFYLLENMDCCLVVYQPYRPLVQFVQDFGQEDQILPLSWKIVNDSLRTDISLLYPPYQIALGMFHNTFVCAQSTNINDRIIFFFYFI